MNATAPRIEEDYETLCQRKAQDHEVVSLAHTLYSNARASNHSMPPWRNASASVKREFQREARQMLGL